MNVSRLEFKLKHSFYEVYSVSLLQVLPCHLQRYVPLVVRFKNVATSQISEGKLQVREYKQRVQIMIFEKVHTRQVKFCQIVHVLTKPFAFTLAVLEEGDLE